MRSKPLLRVRLTGALLVAAVIGFVCAVPLAGAGWQFTPVLLIPIAIFVWAWRAGTDVYPDELRVRAVIGSTSIPWPHITELAPDARGRISALLANGRVIRLTGVTKKNLPLVLAAGKQEIGKHQNGEHQNGEQLSGEQEIGKQEIGNAD